MDFRNLPRDPSLALTILFEDSIKIIGNTNATYEALQKTSHPTYLNLRSRFSAIKAAALKLGDPNLSPDIIGCLDFQPSIDVQSLKARFEIGLDLAASARLTDHFSRDEDEILNFVEIPEDEREIIRGHLSNAREIAARATFLSDPVRRSFLSNLSKAENELFKSEVGFDRFLVIAGQVSGILRKVGDDAKPLAEAVEQARTKTEKHVTEQRLLTEEEKPKLLSGPETK